MPARLLPRPVFYPVQPFTRPAIYPGPKGRNFFDVSSDVNDTKFSPFRAGANGTKSLPLGPGQKESGLSL